MPRIKFKHAENTWYHNGDSTCYCGDSTCYVGDSMYYCSDSTCYCGDSGLLWYVCFKLSYSYKDEDVPHQPPGVLISQLLSVGEALHVGCYGYVKTGMAACQPT